MTDGPNMVPLFISKDLWTDCTAAAERLGISVEAFVVRQLSAGCLGSDVLELFISKEDISS